MTPVEELKRIGINLKGSESDEGNYVVDLPNSDAFGGVYSKLEMSEYVFPIEDNQIVTEENGSLAYETDEYLITLLGDFDNDLYTLVLKAK